VIGCGGQHSATSGPKKKSEKKRGGRASFLDSWIVGRREKVLKDDNERER
jgi:hypothetical protein